MRCDVMRITELAFQLEEKRVLQFQLTQLETGYVTGMNVPVFSDYSGQSFNRAHAWNIKNLQKSATRNYGMSSREFEQCRLWRV